MLVSYEIDYDNIIFKFENGGLISIITLNNASK